MYNWYRSVEVIATVAGIGNIYLAARANMWNWFFGIVMVSLYLLLFLKVKLYADTFLQAVFLVMQFYGIYCWRQGRNEGMIRVTRAKLYDWMFAFISSIILFSAISTLLFYYTDSNTVALDAMNTSLCLVAQWMMSKKWIENWIVWTIANVIAIKMYLIKSLYFTVFLYGVFIMFNCYGYYVWLRLLNVSTNKLKLK